MEATTITVSADVAARLNALAAQEGLPVDRLISHLLDTFLLQPQVAVAVRQMRSMSSSDRRDFAAEHRAWDSLSSDGLSEHPW